MPSHSIEPAANRGDALDVLVVGTGFAGLCTAIKLREAGIESFLLLERGADIGGTWRDNDYPGCACDVQSHLYSFSFEPNPSWTRMFAQQKEIQAYLVRCTEKYGLRRFIRFGENVDRAEYDEARAIWTVRTSTGNVYRAKAVVSAMGALSNPAYPDVAGLDRFQGRAFHSALWDHEYDLAGKRVAVIGTGASAIQFVPQIAPMVGQLHLFQRTAPWVMPKPDRPIHAGERWLYRVFPFLQWFFRLFLYWFLELRVLAFTKRPRVMEHAEKFAKKHIENQIADPELRRKVTPDYTIGCKRILLSDDYYPALTRENVEVVTTGIREVRAHSIVTDDGAERPVDAIVFGTGFTVQEVVPRGLFFGRGGRDVRDVWEQTAPEAYKGTTISGFPNLFLVAGPNTGLGHTSMVFMIESQVAYILDALVKMRAAGWKSVEPRADVQTAYNVGIQRKHRGAVWQSGCKSWYLDASGRNTALWPGFTFAFRMQTAHFDAKNYEIETALARRAAPLGAPSAALPSSPSTLSSAR